MADPGAVVDIVGPENGPEKFLHVVGIFIDAPGATDAGHGVGAGFLYYLLEPGRNKI